MATTATRTERAPDDVDVTRIEASAPGPARWRLVSLSLLMFFVELALIGGLYAAGRHHADVPLSEFKAQITAATLLFRTLTYGIQIPIGGFTYIVWRRKKSWLKAPPAEAAAEPPVVAVQRA